MCVGRAADTDRVLLQQQLPREHWYDPVQRTVWEELRTPLCWQEIDEALTIGPELIQTTIDKIRLIQERTRVTQSRQKSYADWSRRPLGFQVGDQVFLRVSPTKGITRFGMAGKLNPRYIRPYLVIQGIGEVVYRLELPSELPRVHNVFHVSQLRKYIPDPSCIIEPDPI